MKTVVTDDVLFTQRELNTLEFIYIEGVLEVYEDSVYVGELLVHLDEELENQLIDEHTTYMSEDVNFVYINNELYHLYKLEVDYQDILN